MIETFFALPDSVTEENQFQARGIRAILLALMAVGFIIPTILEIIDQFSPGNQVSREVFIIGFILGTMGLTMYVVMKLGYIRIATIVCLAMLFTLGTRLLVTGQGVKDPRMAVYIMIIVLAGVLLGTRAAFIVTIVAVLSIFTIYFAELAGALQYSEERIITVDRWVSVPLAALIVAIVLRFYNENIAERSQAVADANEALQVLNQQLEARVEERTRALQLTIDVGRQINSILDPRQLATEVVELIHNRFNYYHVHIYFADPERQVLTMAGGSGDVGKVLLAQGHRLRYENGLVGKAARMRSAVLIPDVLNDKTWLPNPLLPETKAEAAVPILLGDQLLGVLDVQNQERGSLNQSDVTVLQAVANQLAVALRNANVVVDAQRQAENEMLLNQINQKIQEANDIESLMKTVALEIDNMLDVRTNVRLGQLSHEN